MSKVHHINWGKIIALTAGIVAISAVAYVMLKSDKTIQNTGDERQVLKVELFDRSDDVNGFSNFNSSLLTDWIQENFGDPNNVTMEFVKVPRGNETSDLNKFIAAEEGPDIVFTYNPYYFGSYAQNGHLTDITELIESDGENINALIGEEILKEGVVNGRQYAIPSRRMFRGKYVSYIRKDWLDMLGLKVPETTDELIYTLRQLRNMDPDKARVDEIIPFSSSNGNSPAVKTLLQNFCMDNADSETNCFTDPDYKQGLEFLNGLYNEGLLGRNYMADDDSVTHYSNIAEGKVGFFVEDISKVAFRRLINIHELMNQNNPDAEFVVCDAISNTNGNHFKETNSAHGMYIFIPAYSDKADLAIKYLNWLSQPDVLEALQSRIPSTYYDSESESNDVDLSDFFDVSIVINGYYAKTEEEALALEAASYGEYSELFLDACRASLNDGFNHDLPAESIIQNGSSDKTAEIISKYVAECICAAPGTFESTYKRVAAQFHEEIKGTPNP